MYRIPVLKKSLTQLQEYLRQHKRTLSSISFGVVTLSLALTVPIILSINKSQLTSTLASTTSEWAWEMSGIHGGGTAQVIATDPINPGFATVGGDSWGIYNTTTAGNDWLPAMKGLGKENADDPEEGDFFFMGLAYSKKHPGRVYALTGKLENPGAGGFGFVEGNSYTVVTRTINGGESTTTCGNRSERPRCTGNRVIVDFDAASGIEYVYVATGNGGGIARTTDGGASWTTIGLQGLQTAITGMAIDPADPTVLYIGTRTDNAYKLTNIRTNASSTHLTAAPTRVDEIATIGDAVYAVANTAGVYKLSDGGTTWTRLGASFFPTTSQWSAIGGSGATIYVGGADNESGKSIAKSTDGGSTWTWVTNDASKISIIPWGDTTPWWLAVSVPRIILGCNSGACTYESTSIAVDQFNPNIVYSAGRSGVWKSEDGGASWRPSVNHLAGTMHNNIKAGAGGKVDTDDVDWVSQTSDDYFKTARHDPVTKDYGAATLNLTKNGHVYQVTLGVPRGFLLDGVDIADEYFKAAVIRPRDIDVSDDGKYIYIAQFGGGVMVGRQLEIPPTPTPTPMVITPTNTPVPPTQTPTTTLTPLPTSTPTPLPTNPPLPTMTPIPSPTSTPTPLPIINGLTGTYFNALNFSGSTYTRIDKTINFDWGKGSPHSSIGSDTFSVRWTGKINVPNSGSYTFYTNSDDGVRLFVNDVLLINNWTNHKNTTNKGTISLSAGQKYDIKLEYFENTNNALIKLKWTGPGITTQTIIPSSQLSVN